LGNALAWLGFALVLAAGTLWVRRMNAVAIPESRGGFMAAFGAGAGLGVASFALGNGTLAAIAAGVAIVLGGLMILLWAMGGHDDAPVAVTVGGPILDFTAPDENGAPFDLASLRGRPYLLKFFRGHW